MKKSSTKRALGMSLISLLACGVMFAGSTYAWFTDSIEVKGNKIETGTLKVDLEILNGDKFESLRETSTPVFAGGLWEPGYTDYAVLKIENEGNLAVKWNLKAVKVGADTKKLAEVIDVYTRVSDAEFAAPTSLNDSTYTKVGTLAEVLAKGTMLEGEFAPETKGTAKYLGIMLHMQEEAGNEYQGATDVEFDLRLNAYQLAAEKDGFNNPNYDNVWYGSVDTAWYTETASEYVISTAEEFAGFASIVNGENGLADTFAGKTVKLDANIDLNGINWTAIGCPMEDGYVGFEGTFDGQGHTISNLNINNTSNWGQGLFGYLTSKNVVIKNFTVENVSINTEDTSGAVAGYSAYGTYENIHVTGNVNITGAQHMGGIVGNGYYANFSDCSVIANEGSKITASTSSFVGGIVGYHGAGNVVIEDCDVKNLELTGYGAIGAITGLVSTNNTITGCTAENIILNKTSIETNPSVGLAAGSWDVSETGNAVVSNNAFKNITLNGQYVPSAGEVKELFGSNYSNKPITGVITNENNIYENIQNNLVKLVNTIKVSNEQEFIDALSTISGEAVIDATNVELPFALATTYTIPEGVTVKGAKFVSANRRVENELRIAEGTGEKVVFEDCSFDRSANFFVLEFVTIGNAKNMEFNDCDFKGCMSFYCYQEDGLTEVNNCSFTTYDSFDGYIICTGGTQQFNSCSFDYTNASSRDLGVIKPKAINASVDTCNTTVVLNTCSLTNCSTAARNNAVITKK